MGLLDNEKAMQDTQIQQLRAALSGKKDEDPTRAMLKALITPQNKVAGEGDTNTLKPAILSKLMGEGTMVHGRMASQPQQTGGR